MNLALEFSSDKIHLERSTARLPRTPQALEMHLRNVCDTAPSILPDSQDLRLDLVILGFSQQSQAHAPRADARAASYSLGLQHECHRYDHKVKGRNREFPPKNDFFRSGAVFRHAGLDVRSTASQGWASCLDVSGSRSRLRAPYRCRHYTAQWALYACHT